MHREPISTEGYNKIRDEIRHLEEVEMPKIATLIAEARAEGDLRENAEYHGQRENQGRMQAKINQLKTRLAKCVIVDKSTVPKDVVGFGTVVTVKDLLDGSLEKYEFVGPGEVNYDGDVMKILLNSPIGSALQGKRIGERVEVQVPRGKLKLEVVEIC